MLNTRWIVGSNWVVLCIVVAGLCCLGQAEPDRRWDLGAQLVIADFEGLGEVPGGFGGRCLYSLNDYLALDAEVDYFPDYTRRGGAFSSALPAIRPGSPGRTARLRRSPACEPDSALEVSDSSQRHGLGSFS